MNTRKLCLVFLSVMALVLLGSAPALAAPPTNDNFTSATVITATPFSGAVDITEATTEAGEPQPCGFISQTVWYAFTPTVNGAAKADMSGSGFFDTGLVVYQANGPGLGDLGFVGCASFGGTVNFNAQANTTYYIQAGRFYCCSGIAQLNLQLLLPPAHDNFASAKAVGGLPFTDSADTTAATLEAGEPTPSCANPYGPGKTVWYAFTPATTGSYSANVGSNTFSSVIAVYTGSSLASLAQVACQIFGGMLTFPTNQGTTYYIQVGGLFGSGGPMQFNLNVPPPPIANFSFSPFDPSSFDNVQFYDFSFDPGGVGIQARAWNFGDGATSSNCCPTHRFAADGVYSTTLTITTGDGRTASTAQSVNVRTHDVAIIKLSAPQAASSGQTRQLSVDIRSNRYDETVEVQLFKSAPSGPFGNYQLVGTLRQQVPVRPANRTTNFSFSYTFTGDDASIGKVTFKAVAVIIGARDALPADNEAIASPTKISR